MGSHPASHLIAAQRSRKERGRHAARRERRHLVLHERDEWRNDQRGAAEDNGRELVDQAFPAASWRHQEQAPSFEDGLDRLTLPGPERRVPEPHQRGVKIDGTVSSGSGHPHKFASGGHARQPFQRSTAQNHA